jgi:hypothetical protein
MLSQLKDAITLAALIAPLACAQQIRYSVPFPSSEDNYNATVSVKFDGYNITAPFSNSSEASVLWEARLDVRASVALDERKNSRHSSDDSSEDVPYMSVARIKLGYDGVDSEDLEDIDDSWGYCAAMQPLFNVTVNATEPVDPTCRGILEPQCLDWLHTYVNSSGLCESPRDSFVYMDINTSPWCQGQYFPQPRTELEPEVPQWAGMTALGWDLMEWNYASQEFDDEEDTKAYDEMATRVFVFLASWGERNDSRSGTVNSDTFLNGTVLCLRANETRQGSRSMQEIAEDAAGQVGGRSVLSLMTVALSIAMVAVVL